MKTLFTIIPLALVVIIGLSKSAKAEIEAKCETVQDCQKLVASAMPKAAYDSMREEENGYRLRQSAAEKIYALTGKTNDELRITVTGDLFERDTTFPELGEAYRDSAGLIWGAELMETPRYPKKLTQFEAQEYCKSIGARLPTIQEFRRFVKSLGWNGLRDTYLSRQGLFFSNYNADKSGKKILSGSGESYWSSTNDGFARRFYFYLYNPFAAAGLNIFSIAHESEKYAVRCVVGP